MLKHRSENTCCDNGLFQLTLKVEVFYTLKKVLSKLPLWPTWNHRECFYLLPETTKRAHQRKETSVSDMGH